MGSSVEQEETVIRIVDKLLCQAIAYNASDIHLEPTEQNLRVRFRLDGLLYDQESLPASVMKQVISRIKVLSNINIAEKRIPQDGKFRIVNEHKEIDLRVSTFPSYYGEKVVIRILDRSQNMLSLDMLGFQTAMREQFEQLINRSSGFLLVVGPTGSGKTTTLYAVLSVLNVPEKNIITLEDPIEYNLHGITQGQIHPEAGFTFERGMRALLRQDPDIVLVGEIRDKETAQIAIEASLTGHLVLSTVHTNDAPSVIIRLMDVGVKPFLLNASITGVLAQRLARVICPSCRVEYKATEQEQAILNRLDIKIPVLYRGKGCERCLGLGYKGRTGIFELLPMTNKLRSLIVQNPSFDAIYAQACKDGMQSLLYDGAQKVQQGIITLEELIRAIS
ncbi:type II/IV secretion system protein [Candidatus Dependentiae bacterium]|nr:MAG: type II/IV secretion system protein [Candidatus Dependentiae bacterium]